LFVSIVSLPIRIARTNGRPSAGIVRKYENFRTALRPQTAKAVYFSLLDPYNEVRIKILSILNNFQKPTICPSKTLKHDGKCNEENPKNKNSFLVFA